MKNQQRYVIIGMGAFGREIARTLQQYHADVMVMDKRDEVIQQLREEGFRFTVKINTTDAATLAKFIKPEDVVVLAIGESFEDNIVTIGVLQELKVEKIYTRAIKEIHEHILQRMNVLETLFPERHEGRRFALRLLHPNVIFIDQFAKNVFVCEIEVPPKFFNKTIIELDIRKKYSLNVIGLKEKSDNLQDEYNRKMYTVGFERKPLQNKHSLLVLGSEDDINRLAIEYEAT